ncbi:MAG: DUF432 domain-containing protein [Desulfurococcales archaeon]|nr:DUF432 domain-containing protein [Desulfurococcales archaeon]
MVFGRIDPGFVIEIGDYLIRLTSRLNDNTLVYERLQGQEVKASSIMHTIRDVRIVPAPPFYLPVENLTTCIMLDLNPPLVIAPRAVVNINIGFIVDLVVVSGTDKNFTIIDVFDPGEVPKLSLYGSVDEGVICRYSKTLNPSIKKPGYTISTLSIINSTDNVVKVTTVVAPLQRMKVYYKPGSWDSMASTMVMTIKGSDTAEVELEEPRRIEGMLLSPASRAPRHIQIIPQQLMAAAKFTMQWGF